MTVAETQVAVLGLGYVGLPLAVALTRVCGRVVGFDVDASRVAALRQHGDAAAGVDGRTLRDSGLVLTHAAEDLAGTTFFILAVPTPVDREKRPDLGPLRQACQTVGPVLCKGAVVCVESTVYPGVTQEVCAPLLEAGSGLKHGRDFFMAYSPERVNPGDPAHGLGQVCKVVAAEDAGALERVRALYAAVVPAGVHVAPSIRVAEAAKVLENTQRDLNIALMNELSLICDRLDISTRDVLEAASTKWNFVPFVPGLVGGHCIGVDPYYLTTKAEQLGYHPEVILAGRRINDAMGVHVAQRLLKLLVRLDVPVKGARVGVLGVTFKENVADSRHSRVPDVVRELQQFGAEVLVHDPLANADDVAREYGISLRPWDALTGLDGLVVAVRHEVFASRLASELGRMMRRPSAVMDVKWLLREQDMPAGVTYASL